MLPNTDGIAASFIILVPLAFVGAAAIGWGVIWLIAYLFQHVTFT